MTAPDQAFINEFSKALYNALLKWFKAGQKDVQRAIKRADFADEDIIIDGSPTATAFFKFQAFTTAAVEDSRMRRRIQAALAGNLRRGEGQKSFTNIVNAEFDRAGLSRLKPYQIATIYETNTATAFATGQMSKMLEVQEDFPFWQFSAVMDSRTSPQHAALHGKIFRNGDFTFYPPLRHRCRCTARMLTARQAGRFPKSAMPGEDQRSELYAKAGNPEFAGNKQANYLEWLAHEYKDADKATRKLIDQATEAMKEELKKLGKSVPKTTVKERLKKSAEKEINSPIPEPLTKGGEYVKGTKIVYNKSFFALFKPDRPVGLVISPQGKGSYYDPSSNTVHIVDGKRTQASPWCRERVIYHEFGHALDWQRNMRHGEQVKNLMKTWQKTLGEKATYQMRGLHLNAEGNYVIERYSVQMSRIAYVSSHLDTVYHRISRMNESTFERRGITKADVLEQIGCVQDTIKAINVRYGWGHSTAYFKKPGFRETEFIAHCFENRYTGNRIFEKYLPELYQAMIDYINELQ